VIVESISRLSRNSSVAFRVEDELRSVGVRLCAADEPLEESFGSIVLRHVNIGIARGYHHELMVKSRQGQETSTRQGWHTGGVALYGYRFVTHDHPNPHKASRGINKRTLERDPVRAPLVRAIYDWYLGGGMGLLQIRDRLNADSDRYPPPVPVDPTTARGAWSRSSVWEVLRNPKYTGYQIWNRRARKKGHNRTNPPEAWIWSEEPAHPAIVSREEHDAVSARARANERSRQGVPPTVARPTAKTNYLYRGLLRCGICGLRMWGNHRRNTTYYSCQPSHQCSKDIPVGHPSHVHLNEQRLNDALLPFLATALFGPERADYWRHALHTATEPERTTPARERASEIEAEIADLERRVGRQLVNLEADDVTPALRRRVGERVAEMEAAIAERQEHLVALARASATEAPTLADIVPLLDRLPILASSLDTAPQGELRALFDSLQLDVVYQPADSAVDVAATLYDLGSETAQSAAPRSAEDWLAPSAGLEPAHTAPEADALSAELRGQGGGRLRSCRRATACQGDDSTASAGLALPDWPCRTGPAGPPLPDWLCRTASAGSAGPRQRHGRPQREAGGFPERSRRDPEVRRRLVDEMFVEGLGSGDGADQVTEELEADDAEELGPHQDRPQGDLFGNAGQRFRHSLSIQQGGGKRCRLGSPLPAAAPRLSALPALPTAAAFPVPISDDAPEHGRHPARRHDRGRRSLVAGHRGSEDQGVLVGMRPCPAADGPTRGAPSAGQVRAGNSPLRSFDRHPEIVVGVDDQRGEQLVSVGEVAVEGGGGLVHLPGDLPQRQVRRSLASEELAGRGLHPLHPDRPRGFPSAGSHVATVPHHRSVREHCS